MHEFISIVKYILQSNVINFILMLIILGLIVRKINLGKSFDDSISAVENNIKKSDDEKLYSQEKLKAAELLIEKLADDVAELKKSSAVKGEIFKAEIEASAKNTIAGFEKSIERALTVEEKKISNVLTDKTIAASIELSRIQIQKLLNEKPELHNKFIMDSLDELEKVSLND